MQTLKARLKSYKEKYTDNREQKRYEKLFEEKSQKLFSMDSQKKIIILSSDCVGGRLMKDYRLPCFTPTVNIRFDGEDFLRLCQNPEYYFGMSEIQQSFDKNYAHPVGRCGDIYLYFGHEDDFESGARKWKRGCKLFRKALQGQYEICVIMNDRNEFRQEMVEKFEKLPYKYKVLFTHRPYIDAPHTFYMKGEDKKPYVDTMTDYENSVSLHRRYDRFDFYQWFYEIYQEEA